MNMCVIRVVMALTLEDTSWVPHPCLGSRTRRQPGLSLQTGRRSRSCSWVKKEKKYWRGVTMMQSANLFFWSYYAHMFWKPGNWQDTCKYIDCWTHFMPCWNTELRLVLQMMTSAHCTTTILTKKAVWHVNSTIFLCSYVWRRGQTDSEIK